MISKELQQSLRLKFSPEGSSLRNQQLRMLDILRHIDKVCRENGIRYWLSSGTLLGAVRHGGFIPWDDDLDIEMLRDDYLKFEKAFAETEGFALQTPKSDKFYTNSFSKVRDKKSKIDQNGYNFRCKYNGLFVDVFCLEKTPRFLYFIYASAFYLLIGTHRKCERFPKMLPLVYFYKRLLFFLIPVGRAIARLFPCSKLRHGLGGAPFWKARELDDIFPLTTVKFEGMELPAPGNYDEYLRRLYGDYMKLPDLHSIRVHNVKCEFVE